jgi:hypothetical protein
MNDQSGGRAERRSSAPHHLSRKRNSNLCTQTVSITSQLLLTLRLGTIHDTVNRRASMLVYETLIITININNVITSGGGSFPTSRISNEDYANMNWI